jgi:cold shock CspA family protein
MGGIVTQDAEGTVTEYKSEEGYGFVHTFDVPDNQASSVDAFFHISDISENHVKEGWRLSFVLRKSNKGYRAENLEIISKQREYNREERKRRHGLNKDVEVSDQRISSNFY